jgi:phosphate starvation-inducible PhoH-like protein
LSRAPHAPAKPVKRAGIRMEFDDNSLLPMLFGEHDRHLARIEQLLDVSLASRGNKLSIEGEAEAVAAARSVLQSLYSRIKRGLAIDMAEIDAAIRLVDAGAGGGEAMAIRTRKRVIMARSPGQETYIRAMKSKELVFGLGPAGTGKTYLAVAMAVALHLTGAIDRIILSRPAVEAGERLGFLPGDLKEKVDPYLRPLYDALYDMLPADQVVNRLASGEIEIAPLAFMRGRTLTNAFVILDEAQNTSPMQMKMFLTRLGEGSRMVVTGDLSQIDLPAGTRSGLRDAVEALGHIPALEVIRFGAADVVRHDLVSQIVRAYDARDAAGKREHGGDKNKA